MKSLILMIIIFLLIIMHKKLIIIKITKNLLNIFNSCSKNLNIKDSHIDNQSVKNINTSNIQEIIGLFSDKNNKTKDKNEKNNGKR